jgi:uncharacterized membrane protein
MKKEKKDGFRKTEAWAQVKNARSRMDLILSTVNSGGIVVSLEFGKFLIAQDKEVHFLINVAIILFVIGIAIAFMSQRYSYKSNWEAYLHEYYLEAKDYAQAENHKNNSSCYDKKIQFANEANNVVTVLAVIFLILPFLLISWVGV